MAINDYLLLKEKTHRIGSYRNGIASTILTSSSPKFENAVARRPLKIETPFASVALTNTAGPWQTAAVGLLLWKNWSLKR
ncbi:hypothetical protein FRB95_007854 [Tulasnella sp. JGI-2019a]|nr:hypothetical protein FRB95_007854 [Tulasnella sp. JGI-2019a]